MNCIFHDLIGLLVEVYIDDVVVKSKEVDDHLADLRKVFERTRKYGLKMNLTKCAFGVSARQFLCFLVHERGIDVTQRSINAVYFEFLLMIGRTFVLFCLDMSRVLSAVIRLLLLCLIWLLFGHFWLLWSSCLLWFVLVIATCFNLILAFLNG